jgi:Asp-tRNAAsn/Glu-tRNAGln amidotransferase A subunit and related amidases
MAESLASLTATEAHREITRGALSAEEYVTACLDRIEALEGDVRAFAHIDRAHALRQARDLDEWRRDGRPTGPLHGIPVAIKDIIDTKDLPDRVRLTALQGTSPARRRNGGGEASSGRCRHYWQVGNHGICVLSARSDAKSA